MTGPRVDNIVGPKRKALRDESSWESGLRAQDRRGKAPGEMSQLLLGSLVPSSGLGSRWK